METKLDCGHEATPTECSPGYGIDREGKKHCFACCAERDKTDMRENGKICLYLTKGAEDWKVTNWPGSLSIPVPQPKTGRHNLAGSRYDVWFSFERKLWHGVQYGENTQICHCKRIKT